MQKMYRTFVNAKNIHICNRLTCIATATKTTTVYGISSVCVSRTYVWNNRHYLFECTTQTKRY